MMMPQGGGMPMSPAEYYAVAYDALATGTPRGICGADGTPTTGNISTTVPTGCGGVLMTGSALPVAQAGRSEHAPRARSSRYSWQSAHGMVHGRQ